MSNHIYGAPNGENPNARPLRRNVVVYGNGEYAINLDKVVRMFWQNSRSLVIEFDMMSFSSDNGAPSIEAYALRLFDEDARVVWHRWIYA